ncbi:MAG: hypothetical protein K2N72_03040 [Oscillospiraceae bacterium]|nr:hypothetical protein [Oscillospiraceae bacterium]
MDIITDHGEKIYVAELEEIDEVIENIVTGDKERAQRQAFNSFYDLGEVCKKYANEGLHFGYYFWNGDEKKGSAVSIAMYKKELGYQRIQFEFSKCLNCGSVWRIGNPSWLGMYPKYDFDISECEYPLLDCPKCGGKLSRNAIWIGYECDPENHYAEIKKSDDKCFPK